MSFVRESVLEVRPSFFAYEASHDHVTTWRLLSKFCCSALVRGQISSSQMNHATTAASVPYRTPNKPKEVAGWMEVLIYDLLLWLPLEKLWSSTTPPSYHHILSFYAVCVESKSTMTTTDDDGNVVPKTVDPLLPSYYSLLFSRVPYSKFLTCHQNFCHISCYVLRLGSVESHFTLVFTLVPF